MQDRKRQQLAPPLNSGLILKRIYILAAARYTEYACIKRDNGICLVFFFLCSPSILVRKLARPYWSKRGAIPFRIFGTGSFLYSHFLLGHHCCMSSHNLVAFMPPLVLISSSLICIYIIRSKSVDAYIKYKLKRERRKRNTQAVHISRRARVF